MKDIDMKDIPSGECYLLYSMSNGLFLNRIILDYFTSLLSLSTGVGQAASIANTCNFNVHV